MPKPHSHTAHKHQIFRFRVEDVVADSRQHQKESHIRIEVCTTVDYMVFINSMSEVCMFDLMEFIFYGCVAMQTTIYTRTYIH